MMPMSSANESVIFAAMCIWCRRNDNKVCTVGWTSMHLRVSACISVQVQVREPLICCIAAFMRSTDDS